MRLATASAEEVKQNLQTELDEVVNIWDTAVVPVQIYREKATETKRAGYETVHKTFLELTKYVSEYFEERGMWGTEPHKLISAILQTVQMVQLEQERSRKNIVLLFDQLSMALAQEEKAVVKRVPKKLELPALQERTVGEELRVIDAERRRIAQELGLREELVVAAEPNGIVTQEMAEEYVGEEKVVSVPLDEDQDGSLDGLIEDELEERDAT